MPWAMSMVQTVKRKVYRESCGSVSNRRLNRWAKKPKPRACRMNGGEVASNHLAFVFPGQGSQFVGMGKELSAEFAVARETFAEADDALGFSLGGLCFSGPEDDLK